MQDGKALQAGTSHDLGQNFAGVVRLRVKGRAGQRITIRHAERLNPDGTVYVTDIEHNAIFSVGEDRVPRTLLRSPKIRWPDALSFGPDGWLYVADSALAEVVLQPEENIRAHGPYRIFRFRPGTEGVPGQ